MAQPTVLVVEDDPLQREGLARVLEREGYAVAVAASPGAALALLEGPHAPDLVLLDMLHPRSQDGDGWHFLYRRQQSPDLQAIPVVIVTALGNASAEWAASLGADGLLRKPVDGDQVLAEVRRRLGEARQPAGGPRDAERPAAPADLTKRADHGRDGGAAARLARVLLVRLFQGIGGQGSGARGQPSVPPPPP